MIRVAMIGYGGIAQASHVKYHLELQEKGESKLVAVCDVCPERFEQKMEINIGGSEVRLEESVKKYTDWKEMLVKEKIDMVDICVPTYLHADIAIEALERGFHVFCEKPMSLTYDRCLDMCEVARRTGKKLMMGQSFRFNAKSIFIKNAVVNNTFGRLKSGIFRRLSAPPVWGWDNWYMDMKRSGGAITDLHIHDIDFIQYTFGLPSKVFCRTQDIYSGKDIVHSILDYDDFSITVIGDWSREGMPFESGFMLAFEKATVVDTGAGIMIYPRGGEPYSPEIVTNVSHQAEIAYYIDLLNNDKENDICPPESAAISVKLVNALIESTDNGGKLVAVSAE